MRLPIFLRGIIIGSILPITTMNTLATEPVPLAQYPYFSSIGATKANVRTGPGVDYPIRWVYKKRNLPVEVLSVSNAWVRIRDYEGGEGWVQNTLLKSKPRYVMTLSANTLRSTPSMDGKVQATLSRGVIGRILNCTTQWCKVEINRTQGYINKPNLWGVYINEIVK